MVQPQIHPLFQIILENWSSSVRSCAKKESLKKTDPSTLASKKVKTVSNNFNSAKKAKK